MNVRCVVLSQSVQGQHDTFRENWTQKLWSDKQFCFTENRHTSNAIFCFLEELLIKPSMSDLKPIIYLFELNTIRTKVYLVKAM